MKQLLVFLLFMCVSSVSAQDVIIKKDGTAVVCRIMELNASEIIYKKWEELSGSTYVMDRSLASSIHYLDGKVVSLSKAASEDFSPKRRKSITVRIVGDILGAVLLESAPMAVYVCEDSATGVIVGGSLLVGGLTCIIGGNKWANHINRKAERLQSSALYQYDFGKTGSGSFSASVNIIRDCSKSEKALGIGLRYSF